MKPKARMEEAAQEAMERFNGRGLRLSFVIGKRSRWIAQVLPDYQSVVPRLQASGFAPNQDIVERFTEEPVAHGEGATQAEALKALQPLPWSRDAKQLVVKLQTPMWRSPKDDDAPCLVYTQDRKHQWTVPKEERFLRDCRDTGKAYYHATVKEGKLEIGHRLINQDW